MNFGFNATLIAIAVWLVVPQLSAAATIYEATVQPLETIDQADATITGTIAWHLESAKQQGGGVIHLENGVYKITQALVIPDNTSLIGESRNVIIRPKGEDFLIIC